jgi:MinD superfamily P-loop ATPase
MAHARLNAGEGNSGKLVTEVRKLAEELAEESGKTMILLDGSPGIGCPVIATVTGLSFGVIVTEPTLSGIHDMQRVIDLLNRFNTPAGVIINKYDLSMENTMRIEELCIRDGIEV